MGNLEHDETIVIADSDLDTDRTPDWAAAFRLLFEHLRDSDRLDRLDDLIDLQRRADSFGLREVVLFLMAFFCANPPTGGLREFWYQLREVQHALAPAVGLSKFPSSSSVSRFVNALKPEDIIAVQRYLFGDGTDYQKLCSRPQVQWLDTSGEGWLFADWDPKGRMIRQRTLVDGQQYPEPKRRCADLGAPGQAGRKRGEIKLTRGLVGLAGSGLWLGVYNQPGNGCLTDRLDVIEQAHATLTDSIGDQLADRLVMRVDGEGGEAAVINGIRTARFVPLVRLKQYHLLERADVWERIEQTEPICTTGSGTGPKRQCFEVGSLPLTSARAVDEPNHLDQPLSIRLVVSRYRRTPADQGAGKLIDGWRYEMFGTDLPPDRWPADAVVDGYFGRSTVENRFAAADREIQLDEILCPGNDPGDQLVTLIGLWVWNLFTELGDKLMEDEDVPDQPLRRQDDRVNTDATETSQQFEQGLLLRRKQHQTDDQPAGLSERSQQRLEQLNMTYNPVAGVLLCARDHLLVPKRSNNPDADTVVFRVAGLPCRGCPFRDQCTRSTKSDFRKEVTLPADEVPAAVEIQQRIRAPVVGLRPTTPVRSGPYKIRPPAFLATDRRRLVRRATARMQLRIQVDVVEKSLATDAEEFIRHRRTRQRLPYRMRRRYYRVSPDTSVRIYWDRGVDDVRKLTVADP